jgi:hypothetical protein
MNVFTRNSPYYHLLKHLIFLLKHHLHILTISVFIALQNVLMFVHYLESFLSMLLKMERVELVDGTKR